MFKRASGKNWGKRLFLTKRSNRCQAPLRHRRFCVELLEDRRVLSAVIASSTAQPTAHDQYLLELINRGRANPTAEANRYGISLNQGLPSGTISTAPKQPLAFSSALIASARAHSQWMISTNTFSHTGQGGSDASQRMAAAGYTFVAPWIWAENIGWRGTTGSFSVTDYVNIIHAELYRSPSHRVNQMNPSLRDVGVAGIQGTFVQGGTAYNALVVTEDFAVSGGGIFLTGVVYDDNLVSANRFYTPGEGLGNVRVTAVRDSDGQSFSTVTWSSGGYSLPVPSGTYTVTASGGSLGVTLIKTSVSVTTQNVKADFTRADNALPVVSSLAATPSSLTRPGTVTLTAGGVSDPNGQVAEVRFYRDTNGNGVWDSADGLLGSDQSASGGWNWTGSTTGWPVGQCKVFARARDNQSAWSVAVSTVVSVANAPPSIGNLAASPNPVIHGSTVTLTASGVQDEDGNIARVEFYRGSALLGSDQQGSDGWSWTGSTANWSVGQQTVSARAQDNDGAWSQTISTTVVIEEAIPVLRDLSATPTTVVRPGEITLTASGLEVLDGTPVRVEFYRGDTRLGVDEDPSNGWSWTSTTSGWPVGEQTLSARVQSSSGAWSEKTSTTATICNAAPLITGLSATPAVLIQSQQIALVADGATDPDGTVVRVDFYRGDVLLGSDVDGSNGWNWVGSTSGWPVGEHVFSARANDDQGASSELVTAVATVFADLGPVDFGVVPVFTTRQQVLTVSNEGPEPLVVPADEIGAPFAIRPAEGAGEGEDWNIAPGSSMSFVVTCSPTEEGSYQDVLPLIGDLIGREVQHSGRSVAGWQNLINAFDVDGNNVVSARDVLLLINEINFHGARKLAPRTAQQPGPSWFLDPDGDGRLTPVDVLTVINAINRGDGTTAESEAGLVGSDWGDGLGSLVSADIGEKHSDWMDRTEYGGQELDDRARMATAAALDAVTSDDRFGDEPAGERSWDWLADELAENDGAQHPFELEDLLSDLFDTR